MEREIAATKSWLKNVVIGMNFCPFAALPYKKGEVLFILDKKNNDELRLGTLVSQLSAMDNDESIETTLIIYPDHYKDFYDYLDWVSLCENAIEELGYEGVYQVASFHPQYIFEGSELNDAANYTNRSPYPMVHLIREDSVEKARETHPDIESVPNTNIKKARKKGLESMKLLLASCFSNLN